MQTLAVKPIRSCCVPLSMNKHYAAEKGTQTRRMGNMAVTAPWLDEMNICNIVDQHLPAGPGLEISYGKTIEMLIAARMYSPTALDGIADWAQESGADLIYDVPLEKLNDDRFGRALDVFFTQRHSILASVALHVCERFDIPLEKLHYDPTHLYFTGKYDNSQPRTQRAVEYDDQENATVFSNEDLPPAQITKGKPVDDAPTGVNMLHLGIATYADKYGGVPLFAHVMDGNENGRAGIEEHLGLMTKHLKPKSLLKVSDRGTVSVAHLARIRKQGFHAICSLPWRDVENLFAKSSPSLQWQTPTFLSVEQKRRRDRDSALPLEHYKIASVQHTFNDGPRGNEVACRVVFVHSSADQKVTEKQRAKQLARIEADLQKCQNHVQRRGAYSSPAAVSRRMAKLLSKSTMAKHVTWSMVDLSNQEQHDKAVEGRGNRKPIHEFVYSIDYEAIKRDQAYDGYSALVTTLPQSEKTDDEVFSDFKQQIYSEVVNSTLKDPKYLAVRPVFLHTPERIEALAFLLVIATMAHYLIEREFRKAADEASETMEVPEREKRFSAKSIFRIFRSYMLIVEEYDGKTMVSATTLNELQRHVVDRLGILSPDLFLRQKLKSPPDP